MPEGLKITHLHILLIEDSATDAYMVKHAIQKHMAHPCRLQHVTCMKDALSILAKDGHDIDIILLDLGLPDTRGDEDTFNKLKNVKKCVPVIILTDTDNHDLAMDIINKGAEDYIKKSQLGTNPGQLCDTVDFAICRHQNVKAIKEEVEKERKEKDQILHYIEGGYSC